jgi:DNA polymerase III delta prime subunit
LFLCERARLRTQVFDVFLCHNSEDKPAVREIAQKLSEEDINPWLDEADIIGGSFWHDTIGDQIATVRAAAVFLGQHGVGPWQRREIIALLDQFDKRGSPIIPVILESAPDNVALPWSLLGYHCVDFRTPDARPLKRLVWAITGKRPEELATFPLSDKPAIMVRAAEAQLFPREAHRVETSKADFRDQEVPKLRLYPPLAKPLDQHQSVQLEILRRRAMEYWVDGVLRHSLYKEVLISLGKRQVDEFVDAPWKYNVQVSDGIQTGALTDRSVSSLYDATGLLLILGEPGSGKTTTLLDLAQTLLERAGNDIKERVAVVLNLSSWKKKQPLAEWMSVELSEKYRVPRRIARLWLQRDYLIPLLDGLDEVETSIQPGCVAAINSFIEESNPSGLVVCCRLNEYRWLPARLKLNGAIRIEPLSEGQVDEYLSGGGAELAMLREAVKTDETLKELIETPLMLNVMSLALQGTSGDQLIAQKGYSIEERRKQIFRLYIDRMFQWKGTGALRFPKDKTIGWLSWLARKMREHSLSEFLVEGLQPSWLGTRAKRLAYRTVAALSIGLLLALIGAPCFGVIAGLIEGVIAGLLSGLFLALLILVGVGLGCWSESPLKNGVSSGLLVGLIAGLLFGLIVGLGLGGTSSLSGGLGGVLVAGLTNGLASGLIGGLIVGLNRGGSAVIKHYGLRLILWLKGYTAFNFVKFLDHCAKLILLKKVGGGYIFIHRMLLEYFAELHPQSKRKLSAER